MNQRSENLKNKSPRFAFKPSLTITKIAFTTLVICRLMAANLTYAAPKYEVFSCPAGSISSDHGPKGRPLFTTKGGQIDENLFTTNIDQSYGETCPDKDTLSCYSNSSHQVLQTHLFVTEKKAQEANLGRKLKPSEISELKENLQLMPLFTWLKGNPEHRGKPYVGATYIHLLELRRELSMMKEPGIPGLDLSQGALLANHFEGYHSRMPLKHRPRDANSCDITFSDCVEDAKCWFGDHALVATLERSKQAMFEILNSYLEANRRYKVTLSNYNIYAFSDKTAAGRERTLNEIQDHVRSLLTTEPFYPITFGTSGHYVTITGLEEACCIKPQSGDISCEDQWRIKNSYGEKNSGLYSSRVLSEGFQSIASIRPCGNPGQEKCLPEIQGLPGTLAVSLEEIKPPTQFSFHDLERLGLSALTEPSRSDISAIKVGLMTQNVEFLKTAINYLISSGNLERVLSTKFHIGAPEQQTFEWLIEYYCHKGSPCEEILTLIKVHRESKKVRPLE